MAYPVPTTWNVSGLLNKNGVPFFEGKVYADNLKNDVFQQIAESGISADGSFTLTYSRWDFQQGDDSLEFPTIRIRVEDYQGNNLWTSNIYREPSSALNIGSIDILKSPDQNGDCLVFGTVKNEQGNILAGRKIVVYCLHFVESAVAGAENPSGYFKEIILGETFSNDSGKYEKRYSSSVLPEGLLLDSKEDYGKDKVSLYAEAFELKDGNWVHKATERLVFNGKSEQEINFVLKSKQESFQCEYERLDHSLEVYRNAVISRNGSQATLAKKIKAISIFLKSNTEFPLVVGRERVVENKVQAYFTAYSLYLQLDNRLIADDDREHFISNNPSNQKTWHEMFFALALREGISTLYKLTKVKPTIIQKTLFGAVSDGLICPVDTSVILDLWKKLVNGGTLCSDEDDDTNDDSLTISQLLSLYVQGNLNIVYPDEEDDSEETETLEEQTEQTEETPQDENAESDSESLDETIEEEESRILLPHYEAAAAFDDTQTEQEKKALYEGLLEAYYNVGADNEAFIALLQENVLPEESLSEDDEPSSNEDEQDSFTPQVINIPRLTQTEILKLKAVFDLNDFFEKFAPGVVCTYRYVLTKEDFDFDTLSDLVRLDNSDWKNIVDRIAREYYILYHYEEDEQETDSTEESNTPANEEHVDPNSESDENEEEILSPFALPAKFPGNNAELKKIIYTRKLSELIITWCPQQALLWNLKQRFVEQEELELDNDEDENDELELDNEQEGNDELESENETEAIDIQGWKDVCDLLMDSRWEKFSLSYTDLNEFIGKDYSLLDIQQSEESSPTEQDSNEVIPSEPELTETQIGVKNKVQQLQRLYHLTESAEAIAYLINLGFDSAYKVSSISENEFVARHGNGIGKVEEARQIHRLAQNYMAEAALNVQSYVANTIEEPADILDEDFEEEDSSSQAQQNIQNVTLRAIPRALPKAPVLRTQSTTINTNTAKVRAATRNTANWARLFGNINFTKATQGQSVLSASAYYVDLLKFLKKSTASYNAFIKRRPDYLDLQLTKANAEVPMPTIDLGIELLESLVASSQTILGKVKPLANNNPDNVTAEGLRAEPLEFSDDGTSLDEEAAKEMAKNVYPFNLPANFSRDKAKKILANLSLHFYDIAEANRSYKFDCNENEPEENESNENETVEQNSYEIRELFLDENQRHLVDLGSDDAFTTWNLWGLKQKANKVVLPDKNSEVSGNYIGVLRRVAVFLQRTGFTIQDLDAILKSGHFEGVCYRPQDSEFYQLSNINGYEFAPKKELVNDSLVDVEVDWDSFFRNMAVLVHRKNILGWSLSDVLLTFTLPLEDLDIIAELIDRYGISVQDALVLGDCQEPTEDFINSVYHLPGLVSDCGNDPVSRRRRILKMLNLGLGLSEEDALITYGLANVGTVTPFLDILLTCYRYNLISKTFGISLTNLDKIQKYNIWANNDRNSLQGIRKFSDEWRILSGTSIDVDFYLNLLAPITEEERNAANEFAKNLMDAELGAKDAADNQWMNNLKLVIGAEFGIAEEDFSLINNSIWENFFDAFAEYYEEGSSGNEYPEAQIPVYVDFARKIALFNYIQTENQGVCLNDNLFVQIDPSIWTSENTRSPLSNMWKLVYANYTTDRLLSGEYDIGKLTRLMNENPNELEDVLALDTEVLNNLLSFAFDGISQGEELQGWIKFTKAYELYSKTHCTPNNLNALLGEDEENYATDVKNFEGIIKAHTKDSEWLKFAQEMNDDLRQKKRNALAAFVCWESCSGTVRAARYPQEFIDENDIYAYYLMDVKMEPDMTISRIVQASASIQLFVQRAELGLEGENVLSEEQRSEWTWMKNYRVWEAARKVFLYPENWIASDLRDDKTPFFEELEEKIQEFSDDHTNLENALYEYLEKIREVSSIEIIGATKEDGGDEGGILYTLHIIGRTQGEPHTYYYRKYKAKAILSGEWTPWERLDVDIPSETVAPAIINQRLYLLWPQVTMGQRNLESSSEGGLESIEYFARIQICWTCYAGTKWTGTRMTANALIDASTNPLDFSLGDNEKIEDRYNIKTISSLDSVAVSIIKTTYRYQEYEEILGTTEVMDGSTKINKVTKRIYDRSRQYFKRVAIITVNADGSDSLEVFTADYQPIDDFAPERTKLVHGVFTEDAEFTCGNKGFYYPEDNAVLNYTPGLFRIVATNLSMLKLGDDDKAEDLPFFYMDGRRTFFVQAVPKDGNVNSKQKNYRFELLSHSLVDDFYKRYRDGGLKWLYTRETQALPISDSYYYSYSYYNYYFSVYLGYYMAGDWQAWDLGQTIFRYNYWPNKANVDGPYPAPMVDFVWGGANAMYNWELFFYVPMLIAEKMIAEQSFEEALLWLQLVFDPRENYSSYENTKDFINDLPKGARYWKFLPFFANKDADKSILQMLGLPTKRDKIPDRSALSSLVDKWKNDPFNPHLIARYRNVAYQKYVVMKYLDTLIGWGDLEFSKDTTESVNLAVQFYMLAAELLGPKNIEAPEPEAGEPFTASQLLSKTDDLGNAFIQYENSALLGKDKAKVLSIRAMDDRAKRTGTIIESMFYFKVPRNDVLFSYWDTIADRLYKIRNSLNIEGVKRTLSLFAPPIDPGMLVKARAMGLSIDSILNASSEKPSIYRFHVIVKLAIDMARDASQMGHDLLAILEKQDAEQLQVFKAKCDKTVMAETKAVHEMEVKSLEAEKVRLEEKKETKKSVSKKQKAMHLVSTAEKKYQKLMDKVAKIQETVEKVRNIASATFKIPDFKYGSVVNAFGGPRFDIESLGGTKLAENLVSAAESYAARFAQRQLDAAKTKLQAELERRKKEWTLEDDVADAEVVEVEKQEVVNEIKTQQVEKKQKNIENEILRSEQVYEVLSEKFTNNELYVWLEKELGKVFKKYVNLLIDVAKMAERAYHFEINGASSFTPEFINSTYWDNMRKGLLAPEKILLDLRRMEKAYLENDVHEMEITRPISLSELEEKAELFDCDSAFETPLTNLKSNALCSFQITSKFFENEFSNHSFQRIKDVQIFVKLSNIDIPIYLNVELALIDGSIKKNNVEQTLIVPNTITATSLAQCLPINKLGISFNSDKINIFEGCGAISKWSLEIRGLHKENGAVNYPIEDVIIYLTYTARKG